MLPQDLKAFMPLLISLALPYALVLATPGPNLLVIARASIVPSLLRPLSAALGVACGAAMATAIAAYCATWMVSGEGLELWSTLLFSVVLVSFALRLLYRQPRNSDAVSHSKTHANTSLFTLGLLTALSNPMTISFFLSFFLATPALHTGLGSVLACSLVFVMAGFWFAAVGLLLSVSSGGALRGNTRRHVRRIIACLMMGYAVMAVFKQLS